MTKVLLKMKHLLSIEKLARADMEKILADAVAIKKRDAAGITAQPLAGQIWAMLFSKSSTRTRVSFDVGIRELGGQVIFLPASEIQLGPRRADQRHGAGAGPDGAWRGLPHFRAERCRGIRALRRHPHDQRADG